MIARLVLGIARFARTICYNLVYMYRASRFQLRTLSPVKRWLVYFAVAFFAYCIINFALHVVVSLIGISIISSFINRVVNFKHLGLNPITRDVVNPILMLATFGVSTFIYLVMPEIAILLAFLILPQTILDFIGKFQEYDDALAGSNRAEVQQA